MSTLFKIWHNIQFQLFPWLEEELEPLTEKEQQFVQVVTLMGLEKHLKSFSNQRTGRKPKSRLKLAKAFVAKDTKRAGPVINCILTA